MSTAPQASELQHVAWPATKEGWLNKQSEGGMLGKKFQKRWFVLNGHSISYSHNPESEARRAWLLDHISDVTPSVDKPAHFSLHIISGDDGFKKNDIEPPANDAGGSPVGGTRGGGKGTAGGVSMLNTLAVMAGVRKAAAVDKSGSGGVEIAPLRDDDADLDFSVGRTNGMAEGEGPDLVLNETEVSRGGALQQNQHQMAASQEEDGEPKPLKVKERGETKTKSFLSLMIGSRARDRARDEASIQPHPRSPRANDNCLVSSPPALSPEYLSPRTDDDMPTSPKLAAPDAISPTDSLSQSTGWQTVGQNRDLGASAGAARGRLADIADTFSRPMSLTAGGGGGRGGGVRTVVLQAETSAERDLWVNVVRLALARRRAVRDALRVAVQRLEADAVPADSGTALSLAAIVAELVSSEPHGHGRRLDFDCSDADVAVLWGPLRKNSHYTELDLSCPGAPATRGSLTDETALAIADMLQENTRITSIVLDNHAISDKGALALVAAAGRLAHLSLDHCVHISEQGVENAYNKLADLAAKARFTLRLPERVLALRGLVGSLPEPLGERQALMLHALVWPKEVSLHNVPVLQRVLDTWHVQGLEFAALDQVSGGGGRFQFGLLQRRNGPCGVLAAVQAELLRYLVWPELEEGENTDSMDWDTLDPEVMREVSAAGLVSAMSAILMRARLDKDAPVKLVVVEDGLAHPLAWDSLQVIECSSKEQLEALVRHVLNIFRQPGGVILLMYSLALTRGLQRVWEEAGNTTKLAPSMLDGEADAGVIRDHHTLVVMEVGGWPFCEQSLVNLCLTGQAYENVDPKIKCDIGFLTYTENLRPEDASGPWSDPTVVGSNFKTPTTPIWVLHGGNHYTVLMARSRGLLKLPEPTKAKKEDQAESKRIRGHRRVPSGGVEGEFVLEHYNGLPPAGPRLTKLFMSFNVDENGVAIADSDEERRRWSIDYSRVDDKVWSDKNVPWGAREHDKPAKRSLQLSAVWVQATRRCAGGEAGGEDGGAGAMTGSNASCTGPRVVLAQDVAELVDELRKQLKLPDTVDLVHFRVPKLVPESAASTTTSIPPGASAAEGGEWRVLTNDLAILPDGSEMLLSSGSGASHPIPPALEMVPVKTDCYHVTNKREIEVGQTKTLEFEVALDANTEALVLWSIQHYDYGTVSSVLASQAELGTEAPGHKLQLVEGMMPQIVHKPTVKDGRARLVSLSVARQNHADKWRCRSCSLMLAQPSLSEEERFKRLCAFNEADAPACKVCEYPVEAAGRCLWLDYARMPREIKAHIDASDRWRPEASTRALPPILHVVRTRWADGPTLRPGPLWPSKGGPCL